MHILDHKNSTTADTTQTKMATPKMGSFRQKYVWKQQNWVPLGGILDPPMSNHYDVVLTSRGAFLKHTPYGTQFFHFCMHFHWKAPVLKVHAPPPPTGPNTSTGNPGSATGYVVYGKPQSLPTLGFCADNTVLCRGSLSLSEIRYLPVSWNSINFSKHLGEHDAQDLHGKTTVGCHS